MPPVRCGRHAVAPRLLCLLLGACGAPAPPDCADLPVQRNLSALLRERVVRAELDATSAWDDAALRARIEMATSVIVEETRQTSVDARAGKALCGATIAIEGMGADLRSIVRNETEVSYWVANGTDDRFLVGLTYADLEAIAASYTLATSAARDRPYQR